MLDFLTKAFLLVSLRNHAAWRARLSVPSRHRAGANCLAGPGPNDEVPSDIRVGVAHGGREPTGVAPLTSPNTR